MSQMYLTMLYNHSLQHINHTHTLRYPPIAITNKQKCNTNTASTHPNLANAPATPNVITVGGQGGWQQWDT